MDFIIPKFETDKELFDFIVKNEEDIIYSRKQVLKEADGFGFMSMEIKSFDVKKNEVGVVDKNDVDVIAVINTTNLLDSHGDVHIKGLWDKSLKENSKIKHLQEHQMSFKTIISDKDDLKAYVKDYTWKQLGYDVEGNTQALVFESKVKKSRNEYMYKQYAEGNVDNHSVGMRYVKMATCINDEDYEVQKENYDKYAPMVANKEELKNRKYFWAVTEAKAIEGSAVPIGSNTITPTISVKAKPVVENKKELTIKNWLNS